MRVLPKLAWVDRRSKVESRCFNCESADLLAPQKPEKLKNVTFGVPKSGHNSGDQSEYVNVIGVISEPFAVNGRK